MAFTKKLSLLLALGLGACAADDESRSGTLDVTRLDSTTIAGTFVTDESVIAFESSSDDQRLVALHLDVNGAAMDFTYETTGTLTEDGRGNTLYAEDLRALVDLRDAVNEAIPDAVTGTLQGTFLSRHADWLADAPTEYHVLTREVVADKSVSNTTNDDSIYNTCLRPGYVYTAFYDSGYNAGTQWSWNRTANSNSCIGRCGAGCNIFDTDLMLDCFEHDSCLDHGGLDCSDEFNHAVLEYSVTMGAWCPF